MVVGMMFTVARFESDRIGELVSQGMLSKLLTGEWTWCAPDGYVNREEKLGGSSHVEHLMHARYKRWVELDPEQGTVWRDAWDLLLEGTYSLRAICEELHKRGYRLRSGASFVRYSTDGCRTDATSTVSRVFHNWFYAGWIVIDNKTTTINPKELSGNWEPIVTTEEFEAGLRILAHRCHNKTPDRRHFYLLQGKIYLLKDDEAEVKLYCSTSNPKRKGGGTSYYCLYGTHINIGCKNVDDQLADWLQHIQVSEASISDLRIAFEEEVTNRIGKPVAGRKRIEKALADLNEEEARTARLFAAGKITEKVWDQLWAEWADKHTSLQNSLKQLHEKHTMPVNNLDAAIHIIGKIGIL
jgi:hypothetical protein